MRLIIIKKIKKFFRAVMSYEADMATLRARVEKAENVIRERTDIHMDIHYKSDNQIIVAGKYSGRDYVQIYNISEDDFSHLIPILKDMELYGHMRRVDAPPGFKAVVDHELFKY